MVESSCPIHRMVSSIKVLMRDCQARLLSRARFNSHSMLPRRDLTVCRTLNYSLDLDVIEPRKPRFF